MKNSPQVKRAGAEFRNSCKSILDKLDPDQRAVLAEMDAKPVKLKPYEEKSKCRNWWEVL
jgi:hypothetical protein